MDIKGAYIVQEKFLVLCREKPDTPLLHFVDFLLQTLQRDALPLFNLLRSKYKPSLDRDPNFQKVRMID